MSSITDLPGELRNQIYSNLFPAGAVHPRRIEKFLGKPKSSASDLTNAILQVNRQIREEAQPFMYGNVTNRYLVFLTLLDLKEYLDSRDTSARRQFRRINVTIKGDPSDLPWPCFYPRNPLPALQLEKDPLNALKASLAQLPSLTDLSVVLRSHYLFRFTRPGRLYSEWYKQLLAERASADHDLHFTIETENPMYLRDPIGYKAMLEEFDDLNWARFFRPSAPDSPQIVPVAYGAITPTISDLILAGATHMENTALDGDLKRKTLHDYKARILAHQPITLEKCCWTCLNRTEMMQEPTISQRLRYLCEHCGISCFCSDDCRRDDVSESLHTPHILLCTRRYSDKDRQKIKNFAQRLDGLKKNYDSVKQSPETAVRLQRQEVGVLPTVLRREIWPCFCAEADGCARVAACRSLAEIRTDL